MFRASTFRTARSAALVSAIVLSWAASARAQRITGELSGTVVDALGGHVRRNDEGCRLRAGRQRGQRPRRRRLSEEVPRQSLPRPDDRPARTLRHGQGHAAGHLIVEHTP